VATTLW
jgi:hypothetical protein